MVYLQPVSIFFAGERPSVLWCFYFNMTDGSVLQDQDHILPSNVFMCSGPDGVLSHEYAIKQVSHTSTQHKQLICLDVHGGIIGTKQQTFLIAGRVDLQQDPP